MDQKMIPDTPVLEKLRLGQEVAWINPDLTHWIPGTPLCGLTTADIEDAARRLERFAPFIMECFPETVHTKGIIESPLIPIPHMQKRLCEKFGLLPGNLLLKLDSHLPIAGSVKARGGIYEVLKHTEELAIKAGLLSPDEDYRKLKDLRPFFSQYTVQVGSTGNLGLSIGIMSAAIGYKAVVHMSADARQWKKDLLRSHGVTVVEYDSDYSEAVRQGRALSDMDPNSYFVDDENSKNLFLGYAVAAQRLADQLRQMSISVDKTHPLFVYLPCGVGGAPGGITFGLKQIFGDHVHCFFIEPTQAPCMVLGMTTGRNNEICVQDIGLSGLTHADGLAVGRASGFIGSVMKPLLSGGFTLRDSTLYDFLRNLTGTEGIFLEPSACAALHGPVALMTSPETALYLRAHQLESILSNATHIPWATGGNLVPQTIREEYLNTYL